MNRKVVIGENAVDWMKELGVEGRGIGIGDLRPLDLSILQKVKAVIHGEEGERRRAQLVEEFLEVGLGNVPRTLTRPDEEVQGYGLGLMRPP